MDNCVVCGSGSLEPAFKVNSFAILRCARCGLGRTTECESFDPRGYYSTAYFLGGRSDGYADYAASEPILRSEFRRTIRHLLRVGCRRGRLLEFGCAYGFLLLEALPYFDSVHGIELSEEAVRFCRLRELDVAGGVVNQLTLRGFYDAVVGLDVIEHVPQPMETVRLLGSHMEAGGILLMTTGDWSSLMARMTGPKWRLMTPPQHLSFFTPSSMQLMLETAGFRMLSLSHPWKYVPLSLIGYQLRRIVNLRPLHARILSRVAVPVNLWDAMRVVAVKE